MTKLLTIAQLDKHRKRLKDCPFCGNTYLDINIIVSTDGMYIILCEDRDGCLMSTGTSRYSNIDRLIEAWNRRDAREVDDE